MNAEGDRLADRGSHRLPGQALLVQAVAALVDDPEKGLGPCGGRCSASSGGRRSAPAPSRRGEPETSRRPASRSKPQICQDFRARTPPEHRSGTPVRAVPASASPSTGSPRPGAAAGRAALRAGARPPRPARKARTRRGKRCRSSPSYPTREATFPRSSRIRSSQGSELPERRLFPGDDPGLVSAGLRFGEFDYELLRDLQGPVLLAPDQAQVGRRVPFEEVPPTALPPGRPEPPRSASRGTAPASSPMLRARSSAPRRGMQVSWSQLNRARAWPRIGQFSGEAQKLRIL